MAVIRLTQPFDAFHGTASGQTDNNKVVCYSSRRTGCVARAYVVPDNPKTTIQGQVRALLLQAASEYKNGTKYCADAWTAKANTIMRTNILGIDYYLTGIGLWTMVQMYRYLIGLGPKYVVPELNEPPKPIAVTSATATDSTHIGVVVDVTGLETDGLGMCQLSAPLPGSARLARPNDCRLMDPHLYANFALHTLGVMTFDILIPSDFIVAGNRIGIQITPLSEEYYPGQRLLEPNVLVAAP